MSLKPSNLGSQATEWVLALRNGGNRFSGGRSLGRGEAALLILPSRWTRLQPGLQWPGLHRGHCRVRREGLVILVAWSRAGRLWGRALISTNRFLIRASQALHPHTHAHTPHGHAHICTNCSLSKPPLVLTRNNLLPLILSIGLDHILRNHPSDTRKWILQLETFKLCSLKTNTVFELSVLHWPKMEAVSSSVKIRGRKAEILHRKYF